MFALLTLPRGVRYDPEPGPALAVDRPDEPVGIIIRPGPMPVRPRIPLRAVLAAARG